MKYYIIAGEASGDLHGANLIDAIRQKDTAAIFRFWGGDKMQKSSGEVPRKHIAELAFMGFIEVVVNLRTILKNISFCKADILDFKPDALILIDYPGFNLRIAKWAKLQNIKAFYYISPQIWAWKTKRIHAIINSSKTVFTILPFEKAFYKKYGYDVDYVGHPLLDEINKGGFNNIDFKSSKRVIALLPGSRKQEISKMLPTMLQLTEKYPDYIFAIGAAPAIEEDFYQSIIGRKSNVRIVQNNTYGLLKTAVAAMVTSGTATLETGLFKVPQVVCYKGSSISYMIAKRLVDIKYISLVNLILDQALVKELIQNDFTIDNLSLELNDILSEKGKDRILKGYDELGKLLHQEGASKLTAEKIYMYIQ
jgi:lipid-A-disaccharide synthase